MKADVKQIPQILQTAQSAMQVAAKVAEGAKFSEQDASKIKQEATKEEQTSRNKLETAKRQEATAKKAWEGAKIAVRAAQAALATALCALPFSAGAVAAAKSALNVAKATEKAMHIAYEAAKAHRKLMEARYKIAQAAKVRADVMFAKLVAQLAKHVPNVAQLSQRAQQRLIMASNDLETYQSHAAVLYTDTISFNKTALNHKSVHTIGKEEKIKNKKVEISANRRSYKNWKDYKSPNAVIRPEEIRDRMNPSEKIMRGLLEEKFETDPKFREQVEKFRKQIASSENEKEIARRNSRRNMAGLLGEKIIKNGLSPFAERVDTQARQDLKDGGYTKIDIVLENLKQPMVFGRGEGMGAREGRSVAIEAKAGKENYLRQQEEHILRQVEGHKKYDVSLVLSSRDLKGMSGEEGYRDDIRDAGSRVIGILPHKNKIDDAVWNFLTEQEYQEGEINDSTNA